jgi:3-methyladenine DNA glycosylase AlkD
MLKQMKSDKFYVNMAQAWLISEMYIKYPGMTKEFLKSNNLNDFTQNKAISKIKESFRANEEEKKLLNDFKRNREEKSDKTIESRKKEREK